jgi:hypothetical protein
MDQTSVLASGIAAVVSVIFLLSAVFGRWSYGFYILLRVVVCGAVIYFAQRAGTSGQVGWLGLMVGIAVLFNPIIRVHLSRSVWRVINLIATGVFAVWLVRAQS